MEDMKVIGSWADLTDWFFKDEGPREMAIWLTRNGTRVYSSFTSRSGPMELYQDLKEWISALKKYEWGVKIQLFKDGRPVSDYILEEALVYPKHIQVGQVMRGTKQKILDQQMATDKWANYFTKQHLKQNIMANKNKIVSHLKFMQHELNTIQTELEAFRHHLEEAGHHEDEGIVITVTRLLYWMRDLREYEPKDIHE